MFQWTSETTQFCEDCKRVTDCWECDIKKGESEQGVIALDQAGSIYNFIYGADRHYNVLLHPLPC